ncbi:MAG: cobaltochelatase subunit CobN [Methanolobus sp.]
MKHDYQVEWICDRAIAWSELREMQNADKKITIIYNHEGGKNNIRPATLISGSSFTLLLEAMQEEGYYLGDNVTIQIA